ncbi:ROK family protein [Sulfidibacter corallicola]|uniref:ROK family protein n=1 Tax=Sulfidibacter corallicola TaxID=2818388 RepID=A0A8A4TCI6_SULCO|nr:ROK family protein [Sulfidibacter corallicola]QTD47646.1 ROK family protein [Sulfidibacter corallicola]
MVNRQSAILDLPHDRESRPGMVVGIDIGGTNTDIGLVTRGGDCLARKRLATRDYPTAEAFADGLARTILELLADREIRTLAGVGVGAPNGNAFRGTIEHAPNLKWKGVIPLAKWLHRRVLCPIHLDNDANAAAMGEMLYGGARGLRDFVMVTLGTGLGSGVVIDGKLVRGHDGFAGELGHTVVMPGGRPCGCGRRGCLETYVSVTGLIATVIDLLDQTWAQPSRLEKSRDSLNGKLIAAAAEAGDPIAELAFRRTGHMLALGLANAAAITNPEAIVLAGGLAKAEALLLEPTRAALADCLHNLYRGKLRISVSKLQADNAGLLGAAASVWTTAPAVW